MVTRTEAYEVGEEVVVRLARARVFDPRAGGVLRERRLPPWTIARVMHCHDADGAPRYVVSFRHRDAGYIASVDSGAIEGIA
jgi:hypothetical protein